MFKITKSKYPNLWLLAEAGYEFHDVYDATDIHDMCTLVRRVLLGSIFLALLPFMVAGSIISIVWFPFLFYTGAIHLLGAVLSPVLGVAGGIIWGVAIAALMAGILNLFVRRVFIRGEQEYTPKPPGLIKTWYDGVKDKYCPVIEMERD